MKFIAFLRNVNLGQRHSPTRAQLESAFLQAGASMAASVMSNGTLVFSVADSTIAKSTSDRASEILKQVCGLNEPAFVRSLSHLAEPAAEDPFADFGNLAVHERCISIFDRQAIVQVEWPLESQRGDCIIFRIDDGEALSVTREVNGKAGYPTPVLESALNVPVTTRSWTTLLRAIEKYG
jgi:uncharacterized protein (DUF1697 family)